MASFQRCANLVRPTRWGRGIALRHTSTLTSNPFQKKNCVLARPSGIGRLLPPRPLQDRVLRISWRLR